MQLTQKQKHQLRCIRSLSPTKYYHHIKTKGLAAPENAVDWALIDREIMHTLAFGARFLFHDDPRYPALLKCTACPPPVLVYKGDISLLDRSCISLVGSRKASLQALKITQQLSRELSAFNQVIVSGLALGIDTEAHKFAQKTIAVLGCGIDVSYPFENMELQERLTKDQLVITEYPFGCAVKKEHFPARNRIISGLSWGLVVIEANYQSGSMITAKHALAQGREVFAVPSHPLDPRSQGCNYLIKQGAGLVQTVQDILEQRGKQIRQAPESQEITMGMFAAPAGEAKAVNVSSPGTSQPRAILDSGYSPQSKELPTDHSGIDDIASYQQTYSKQHEHLEVDQKVASDDSMANLSDRDLVLGLVSSTPMYADEIARHTGLSVSKVRMVLIELEMDELVHIDSSFRVFHS